MSDELPDPLVPAEVDLRGYEFMPFYAERCFGSESWLEASHEARVAMLKLWWRAYGKEKPAASLPDRDTLLREYAGYAEAPRAWLKIRDQALRGFVKCSDGRLYHKVLSVIVVDAWEFRNKQRNRTEAARLARLSQRLSQTEKEPPKPSVTESIGQDRIGQDRTSKSTPLAPSDFSLEAGGPVNGKRKNGHPTPFAEGEVVIAIPLVGDGEYPVRKPLVDELEQAYPAVDVPQTLREIRAWNLSNPRERKTAAGIVRHINRWCAKEQNRG